MVKGQYGLILFIVSIERISRPTGIHNQIRNRSLTQYMSKHFLVQSHCRVLNNQHKKKKKKGGKSKGKEKITHPVE